MGHSDGDDKDDRDTSRTNTDQIIWPDALKDRVQTTFHPTQWIYPTQIYHFGLFFYFRAHEKLRIVAFILTSWVEKKSTGSIRGQLSNDTKLNDIELWGSPWETILQ